MAYLYKISSNIALFHQPTLMHKFLYSLTICLLHHYPRYVSSINMPILRRKNCIHTASGIFALCKRLHSTLVESSQPVYCADVYRERKYQTLCEYHFSSWGWACWCWKYVEDNSVIDMLLMNKENCALKLVDEIILYYDARSKKHQNTAVKFCECYWTQNKYRYISDNTRQYSRFRHF